MPTLTGCSVSLIACTGMGMSLYANTMSPFLCRVTANVNFLLGSSCNVAFSQNTVNLLPGQINNNNNNASHSIFSFVGSLETQHQAQTPRPRQTAIWPIQMFIMYGDRTRDCKRSSQCCDGCVNGSPS